MLICSNRFTIDLRGCKAVRLIKVKEREYYSEKAVNWGHCITDKHDLILYIWSVDTSGIMCFHKNRLKKFPIVWNFCSFLVSFLVTLWSGYVTKYLLFNPLSCSFVLWCWMKSSAKVNLNTQWIFQFAAMCFHAAAKVFSVLMKADQSCPITCCFSLCL